MRDSLPDLTEDAVEIPEPPPVPPRRDKSRERAPKHRRDPDRPSVVDFDAVASSYPPAMVVTAEQLYRRPMWVSRAGLAPAPAPTYLAYALSALVGAALAISAILGLT